MSSDRPLPSDALMNRVGCLGAGPALGEAFEAVGAGLHDMTVALTQGDVDFDAARVLDLGCGSGRVLRHWGPEVARGTRLVGVDIDEPSIAWCREHLGELCEAHVGPVAPPLDLAAGSFDLVYAFSLFTHLVDHWADWLVELHRLLRPGGMALVTVLLPARMQDIIGMDPDGREGVVFSGTGRNWDVGGPVVFHARWWIEEHWGRAFEVEHLADDDPRVATLGDVQSVVLLRAKPVEVTSEMLRAVDLDDPREAAALQRADQVRDPAGPRAFDSDHHLAAAIRRQLAEADPALVDAGLDVSSRDDMYLFCVNTAGSQHEALSDYFRTGLDLLHLFDDLVAWRFGGWEQVPSLLDVGAGYGRVGRFLVQRMPAVDITAADVQADAVVFQALTFGTRALFTTAEAIQVPEGTSYGIVSAVSLFTHLPPERFVSWLAQLWKVVAPNGVLAFTTHNAELAPPEVLIGSDGIGYVHESEIPALDTRDYGATFTTDAFVRRAIAQACEGDEPVQIERTPLAIGRQDLYVLGRSSRSGGSPITLAEAPWGSLDGWVPTESGETRLRGWAGDTRAWRAGPVTVQVSLDGEELPVTYGLRRADVAAHFGRRWDAGLVFSGWEVASRGEELRPGDLRVVATVGDQDNVIYDGPLPPHP